MRSKFYLYASGNESDIRALYDYLKLPDSEIKPLKTVSPEQAIQWMWRSPYQECFGDFPEDELEAFLNDNFDLLQQLKAHRESLRELAGMIVCQLGEGEQPRGYSISPTLIRMLSDINASLEVDVVQLVIGGKGNSES
jgi:hypothetical protein